MNELLEQAHFETIKALSDALDALGKNEKIKNILDIYF
jgi:hypothetical protein